MSKNQRHGGKSGHDGHDGHHSGHHQKVHVLIGTKGDDPLTGTDGKDIIRGKKGDDHIDGGAGNDLLFGDQGDDFVFGGLGNDVLFGGKGNDQLDGGAGRDVVLAGKGDDFANYTASENQGACDFYDGGKGFDTLQLTLTSAEAKAAEAEIEAFKAFLTDGGKAFHFESLGLTVRNFEDLKVETVGGENTAPVANPDEATVDEDHEVSINVLSNDTDADAGASLKLVASAVTGGLGTAAIVGDQVVYNPGGDYQFLAVNESANVKIAYTISDEHDATASSFVDVVVTGVNDDPVADNDIVNVVDGRIHVAVLGVEGVSTHVAAAEQLDITKFFAEAIDYAAGANWSILNDYDVVVLGDSGLVDYGAETATGLFAELKTFVTGGGGVVTTGNFAFSLKNLTVLGLDTQVITDADDITPITRDGFEYAFPPSQIVVAPRADGEPHPFGTSVLPYDVKGLAHELAKAIDSTATPLAKPESGSGTAVAYDEVGAGRTVYLGSMYTASDFFMPGETREGDLDTIFEQAVAWAAGARGDAPFTVTIDVLANDMDVDESDVLAIDFPTQSMDSAALSIEDGNIVYTPSAEGLLGLNAGLSIEDSFQYTVFDGHGGSDMATVNVNIDALL
jgi:hypothetical protein